MVVIFTQEGNLNHDTLFASEHLYYRNDKMKLIYSQKRVQEFTFLHYVNEYIQSFTNTKKAIYVERKGIK